MKYKVEAVSANSIAFELSVTGLKGGHSGLDNNLGGSTNKPRSSFLWAASELGLRLSSMEKP
ncbi:MAG: hypothetical protein H6540_00150 [Bacteroidales bacterium]|nr:hypothetical protein [Bacteroidales bacterium]